MAVLNLPKLVKGLAEIKGVDEQLKDSKGFMFFKVAQDIVNIAELDIDNISFEEINDAEQLFNLLSKMHESLRDMIITVKSTKRAKGKSIFF